MTAWREYLGYGTTKLEPLLTKQMKSTPDYNFIQGWQGEQALSVLANSSDTTVRTPGVMKAHSIATHPSPTRASVIAWRCDKAGTLAHSRRCRRCASRMRQRRHLGARSASRSHQRGARERRDQRRDQFCQWVRLKTCASSPDKSSLWSSVRAMAITSATSPPSISRSAMARRLGISQRTCLPNILKGNPHGAWHFLSQPATLEAAPDVPAPIAEWRKKPTPELAVKVRQYLEKDFPLNSPLLRPFLNNRSDRSDTSDLTAKAPSTLEVQIPAALANGTEFIVTGKLASKTNGSVQMQVLTQKPVAAVSLVAGKSESAQKSASGATTTSSRSTAPRSS
jgi:hypothetical protein